MNLASTLASLAILVSAAGKATRRVILPEARPTPAQAAAVRAAVAPDMREDPFTVGFGDLNGDGRPDLVAHYQGTMWCGSGGCTSVAILAAVDGYSSKAINLPNFIEKIAILPSTHNGMHDLRFDDATYVYKWTGTEYR